MSKVSQDSRLGVSESGEDSYELSRLHRHNQYLEQRLDQQEQRHFAQEKNRVISEYRTVQERQRDAEAMLARAIAESNGDEAATALKIRDKATEEAAQLEHFFSQLDHQEKTRKPTKPPMDPVVERHAKDWISENSWYDPNGRDMDSKITLVIDQDLVEEGYSPHTTAYWKELDRRVKQRLPHHFEEQDAERPQKRQIYISPARKEALIQAGVWDDPKLRMKYAKRYEAWDRENAS